MVVPLFGWSAGDLVTSIKILHSIASAFKEASGASSQYKETASWLESFASDLERMKEYITENPDARYTKNIIEQVGRIDRYYGEFETYLQKYDKGLSSTAGANGITATAKKIKWALQELKGKVDSLKFAVTGPIVSLNLLLALQCRIDLSTVAEKVIGMPPIPKISDIDTAFQGLHDRIQMLEEIQARMREDLADERAMIRDEMRQCTSEASVHILSSHCDSTAQVVSMIEDKDVAWKESLSTMRRHLENIEETQSRTQRFYEELQNQLQKLDRMEKLLKNNDNLATSVKDLHSKLAALVPKPHETTLLEMTQAAGAVVNIAVGVGMFFALARKTIDGVPKREGHQELAHGYYQNTASMTWSETLRQLPSYPFERNWAYRRQHQGTKWDLAACAWVVVVPDLVLMMLRVINGENPTLGDRKDYFLPAEGIHVHVLRTDASLYLGQLVWLKITINMGVAGYLIRASSCFTEEMINNLKEDSARWLAFVDANKDRFDAGPEFSPRYQDSDIFKARWQPLRATIQEKIMREAEEDRKRNYFLGSSWASSFQAGSWDSKDAAPPPPPPPPPGGGGSGTRVDQFPGFIWERIRSKALNQASGSVSGSASASASASSETGDSSRVDGPIKSKLNDGKPDSKLLPQPDPWRPKSPPKADPLRTFDRPIKSMLKDSLPSRSHRVSSSSTRERPKPQKDRESRHERGERSKAVSQ